MKFLGKVKERLKYTRYFTYIFVSVWKVLVFFATMVVLELYIVGKIDNIFVMFTSAFGEHKINITTSESTRTTAQDFPGTGKFIEIEHIPAFPNTPINVFVIQSFASFFCFALGKFACKICIQVQHTLSIQSVQRLTN